jgi:hydrogenase maturation protein HypF
MAENGIDEKVIGIAFDGTGYGADGNIWGGEFLIADLNNFERAGHFQYTPMPGGDKAIKEPWRMAVSYLYKVLGDKKEVINVLKTRENGLDRISENDIDVIVKMIEKGINSPLTSSAGRLFDAVSSIIGIKDKITFEGEAAIEMEMKAERKCTGIYSYEINSENNIMLIDASLIIAGLHKDIFLKMPQSLISAKFHNTMAEIILDVCAKIREESGLNITALSGGVFQNMLLLEKSVKKLEDKGFKVITHSKVPANDGGISLGQAVIAARRASLK